MTASHGAAMPIAMGDVRDRLERLPLLAAPRERPIAYAAALTLSGAAAWLRWSLDDAFPPGFPFISFLPAVILSSFLFGRGPGTLAAVASGLIAWGLFIPPMGFAINRGVAVALAFYVFVVAVDITLIHWMQRANTRLSAERERSGALAERTEILFRELQHRVSNNLQMAGAVLALRRRGVVDAGARAALDEAAARLQLIGRIQRQLYDPAGGVAPLGHLLHELVGDVVAASGQPGVTWRVEAEAAELDPDAVIAVALIVAEAVANAIEHGFATRETGEIVVSAAWIDGSLAVTVRDDGAGVPAGFDASAAKSLGLTIVRSLARQLGARLEIVAGAPGTIVQLLLPASATRR